MELNYQAVNRYEVPMLEFAKQLHHDDLYRLTDKSVDAFVTLIEMCEDADIIFVPDDPDANDPYAANPAEQHLAWHIGHNIVHATASAEEYAFAAAELARGVPFHGRSRAELAWQTITTVDQCLARLAESRRMRLASLDMWPNKPNLKIGYMPWREAGFVNALGIFAWGLAHDDHHIRQITKIMQQSQTKH